MTAQQIIQELQALGSPAKALHLSRFFKTGKGQYGEGDQFLGVTVPQQRTVAKKYRKAELPVLRELIVSPWHEVRLTGLLILLSQYEKSNNENFRQTCIDFYLSNTAYINNWDLVDLTCYKLLGTWLENKDRQLLYELVQSASLWEQRIAIVSCMHFVRKQDFTDCLNLSDRLLHHPHDLIHKAVGWLLREVGKKNRQVLTDYLRPRYRQMPRTMLRYAIEHYPADERKKYLTNEIR